MPGPYSLFRRRDNTQQPQVPAAAPIQIQGATKPAPRTLEELVDADWAAGPQAPPSSALGADPRGWQQLFSPQANRGVIDLTQVDAGNLGQLVPGLGTVTPQQRQQITQAPPYQPQPDLAALKQHGERMGTPATPQQQAPIQVQGGPPPVQIRTPDMPVAQPKQMTPQEVEARVSRLMTDAHIAGLGGQHRGSYDPFADSAGMLAQQQQNYGRGQDSFIQAMSQTGQEERSRIMTQMGLSDQAIRRGEADVNAQKVGVEDATNRARIASAEGISARDLEAKRMEHELNAELARGNLSVAQRKQLTDEYKQAWEMEQDKQGQRVADAMAAQGRTPSDIRAYQRQRGTLFPQTGQPQPGFAPGQPFELPGQRPVEVRPTGKQNQEGGQAKQGAQRPVEDSERFQKTFGDELHQELEDIRTGKAGDGKSQGERMKMAALVLARRADRPENKGRPELGQAMIDYMRGQYGNDFDEFVRPTQSRQFFRRAGNLFSPPSEDEAVSAQYRNLMGESEKDLQGWERLLSTPPSLGLPGTLSGLFKAGQALHGGKREGESRSNYLGRALLEAVPGRQAFKLW